MIENDEHFSEVLTDADQRLARRPLAGTTEHAELVDLLGRIADYRPRLLDKTPGPFEDRRRELAERLEAFEARLKPHYGPHWQAMVGGDLRPPTD